MKRPLYCQKCHVEIFYDLNMVMIKDELWLTHFKKEDAFCDLCIEEKIGRKIIHEDLKLSDGDMIPCNLFWEGEQHYLRYIS
jgi:hypothetical protein